MNLNWWKTYRVLTAKRQHLHWSKEQLESHRSKKLCELLHFSYDNSLFYRRHFDEAGIHPSDVRCVDDLKKIPILRKKKLRLADPDDVVTFRSRGRKVHNADVVVDFTSGSTGKPLKIKRTWQDLCYIKANDIRAFQQTGLRFRHRQVILKSSAESLTGRHWFERIGIMRKYWLSIVDEPEKNLARLSEIRPQHVHGYPSGIVAISEILKDSGKKLHIPIICTGAEMLDSISRHQIQEAFDAEIFDLYGCKEVGNIAWECKAHQGLHMNDDAVIVEVLDDNGREVDAGEEGEIVVTLLDCVDYPIVRYSLGDRVVRDETGCSCGVNFDKISIITGRADGRILLPSGEWIPGMVFYELRTIKWISSYRVLQDHAEYIRLQVVPKCKPSQSELEILVTNASVLLQGRLTVNLEVLDRLEHDAASKRRTVICRLPLKRDSNGLEDR